MSSRSSLSIAFRILSLFFLFDALKGLVIVLAVLCGLDLKLRWSVGADLFCYTSYLLLAAFFMTWAERLAAVFVREDDPSRPPSSEPEGAGLDEVGTGQAADGSQSSVA